MHYEPIIVPRDEQADQLRYPEVRLILAVVLLAWLNAAAWLIFG